MGSLGAAPGSRITSTAAPARRASSVHARLSLCSSVRYATTTVGPAERPTSVASTSAPRGAASAASRKPPNVAPSTRSPSNSKTPGTQHDARSTCRTTAPGAFPACTTCVRPRLSDATSTRTSWPVRSCSSRIVRPRGTPHAESSRHSLRVSHTRTERKAAHSTSVAGLSRSSPESRARDSSQSGRFPSAIATAITLAIEKHVVRRRGARRPARPSASIAPSDIAVDAPWPST